MKNKKLTNLVILVLLLASFIGYVYYVSPTSLKLKQSRGDLINARENLSTLNNNVQELTDLKALIPTSEAKKQQLLAQIPTYVDQEGIIKDFDKISKLRGIELRNIGFSVNEIDPSTGIGVLTMTTGFEGTYQDLINLLSDIENNPRKLRVTNISVQVLEVSRNVNANVVFTLSIESYYQSESN